MEKKIVIINGTGGSGKDTFISLISKYTKIKNYSTIDKIKQLAKEIGWNEKKTDKDRKFLSDLKKLIINYNDFCYQETIKTIEEFQKTDEEIIFIHVKEIEEIKKIINSYPMSITLLIKRNGLENITTNDADKNVDNYSYDYVINNSNDIKEFEVEAKNFYIKISKGSD